MEPKAVIFDYGNVLCQPQQPADLQAMAAALGIPEADFLRHYWLHRLAYDEAKFDGPGYWASVASGAGLTPGPAAVESLIRMDVASWMRPNPPMLDWARNLRAAGMRTAILSNMPPELRDFLTTTVDWLPAFDHLTFSCDIRLCKPDPAIYQHCVHGLGIAAGDALFLDDREENVDAARRAGLHAEVFTTADQAARTLPARYRLPAAIEW